MSSTTIFGNRLSNGSLFRTAVPSTSKLITPQHQWSSKGIGSGQGEVKSPTDVAFLPNRNIVVSDHGNNRLQVFDISGRSKFMICDGCLEPRGVTVDKLGATPRIAVVDQKDKTVKFFTLDGDKAGSWAPNLFGNPVAIAINSDREFIVTDDHTNYAKINVMSEDGKLLRKFGSHAVNAGDMFLASPNYVTTDHFDRIIVSDNVRHCLKVFDTSGRFLTTIEGMKHPHGVCADAMDNILIAECGDHGDHGNDCISLYSGTSSKLVEKVVTNITRPHGLAMSDVGFMAITESGQGTASVKFYQI
jgi:tripartite motif-containing protein 2/3